MRTPKLNPKLNKLKKLFFIITMLLAALGCSQYSETKKRHSNEPQQERFSDLPPTYVGRAPENFGSIRSAVGSISYNKQGYYGSDVELAILDNGFKGLESVLGKTLPPDLALEPWPEGEMGQTYHGTKMAEIAYSIATGSTRYVAGREGPRLRLFVTSGPYRNLEAAVDRLIELKKEDPDRKLVALYAQVWEYGSNMDGTGYIDSLVKRATRAGVVWINAAGNHGSSTYADFLRFNGRYEAMFANGQERLQFDVANDRTPVKIVLGWNDFRSSPEYRTSQDLNMALYDTKGNTVSRAVLMQDGRDHGEEKGYSSHAREQINGTLPAGRYQVKIWARNGNFRRDSRFWLVAGGPKVTMVNPSPQKILMAPAGLKEVVTIGATDISYGNFDIDGTKPDLSCPSKMTFEDGSWLEGTSTASAVCAGAISVFLQGRDGLPTKSSLIQKLKSRASKALVLP